MIWWHWRYKYLLLVCFHKSILTKHSISVYWCVTRARDVTAGLHFCCYVMRAYAPCTQLELDPQYPLNTNIHVLLREQWIGPLDWASGPWPWLYKIHYMFVVIRTYLSCTKWRQTTRSCSPVPPRYNIHVLLREQWIVEGWAIASRSWSP